MSIKPSLINYRNTHIIPFRFEYYEPGSLKEVFEILEKLGNAAKILAGGTDLLVKMKTRQVEPKALVNIKRIKELKGIVDEGDRIRIGALTTLRELEESSLIAMHLPALHDAVKQMASIQIRNMATIGGNLCNASPAADTAPPLLVHEALVKTASIEGERIIPITEFFKGPGLTVLKPTELLVEIIVNKENGSSAFSKMGRIAMDLAIASVAIYLKTRGDVVEDVRVAAGAVAPTPIRCPRTETMLKGRMINEVSVELVRVIEEEVKPISDVRATAEYRRHLVKILAYDVFHKAVERSRGGT
ncbi:aerobic-type carbon monoxide dehydrogenase, middle subunit CoxM/CutM - like protein [Desulfurococcus amylolyticus 1221n]|uniref:Aerobic-type carbon monoxide dehydrogenase, middle subunit CoxM/CutM-like protein n=3 Tax=Desulfurococcus amylolyticus TaxID=94694 RepID=B8D4N1_DESA1|nr:xanthine dehydrogenase family protein subunit M [Desulfurococcus amylolyticus]ACL11062.1 aerobic-type carbon monoxide dehydrogenase, middle subunit CoxM/CutM - like protein [Desulfurococcus amylolyticus 1221n]